MKPGGAVAAASDYVIIIAVVVVADVVVAVIVAADTDTDVAAATPVSRLDFTVIKKVLSERKIELRHGL